MLVAASVNILSKIHKRPSGDMSPFKDNYAQAWCECLRQRNARGTADDRPWPRVHSRTATGSRTSERVRGTRRFSEIATLGQGARSNDNPRDRDFVSRE